MKNTIYLRKNKVIIEIGKEQNVINYVMTILKNIEQLGYTFDLKLIEALCSLNKDRLSEFYNQLITDLRYMVGADVEYNPMYVNFPEQVMNMEEAELYINAIMHYFGDFIGLRILPKYIKEERDLYIPIKDSLKIISLGTEKDFKEICINLLGSNTSISESDKLDIKWFVKNYKYDINSILPLDIPQKENLTYLTGLVLQYVGNADDILLKYFSTATDVLRLATALSNGDVSLASNTRFISFSRKQRLLLLGLLDNCKNATEDMIKYKNRWIRLGERLHPFEYKSIFQVCDDGGAFDIIRNNKPFETFNSKIESFLVNKDVLSATDLLIERPGIFARKLDHLIRLTNVDILKKIIILRFRKISNNISTPILLQLFNHFTHRNDKKEMRIFFPKGNLAKIYGISNDLSIIDNNIRKEVVEICKDALINKFKLLPKLDNTFIDPELKNYTVPFSQRSSSKSLITISRGSKLKIEKGNTIRFFIWWKDVAYNRVDIDLSAVMYDNDWKYLEHVSYTNLRSEKYHVVHSGDITSAPEGASEFLDIDIDSVLKYGGRYIVMSLNSFTSQSFLSIPKCFVGWMVRKNPNSNEIYEPSTVENKIDLSANTRICIPVIIDLLDRKIIWTDLAFKKNPYWVNNIEGNQKGMVLIGQAFTSMNRMNLYDLFMMHVLARGKLVETKDEADNIFSIDDGITPFDLDIIASKYML